MSEIITIVPEFSSPPDAYLNLTHDQHGNFSPIETFAMMDGALVRVKSHVIQSSKNTERRDFVVKDDGSEVEWGAAYGSNEPERLIVTGIGSSEIIDMDGDVMTKSALESMCRVPAGLNTYLMHKTDFEHLFGSLVKSPELTYCEPDGRGMIQADKGYAAVRVTSDVERDSPKAMNAYVIMKKGRQFGWSVGCYYTKFEPRIEKGRKKGATVFEVAVAEWSTVTMPSNQQSWCELSVKALIQKGYLDPTERPNRGENLYRLLNAQDFPDPLVAAKLEQLADYFAKGGIYLCTADRA